MANVLSVVRDPARLKRLGRYELEECLGAEGSRETYRARVRGLAGFDRIFAVKCLRRRSGAPLGRTDAFITAAKRLAIVTDARVARVLDADIVDGVAIAVTEFVHGLDLDRFREWAHVSGELVTGSDAAAERWHRFVAYLGTEIAGGLASLHGTAPTLVHGGLSPRNVIVTARGGIKLLDVGLSVAAQKGGEPPSPRTLAYAAPELASAEPTPSSDVRALGAMLFELITGELPPSGVTSQAAREAVASHWPAVAELIGSTLADDPAQRPRAAKVAEALASQWAAAPEAAMMTEMANLVRNFSAFVADSAPSATPAAASGETGPADRFPPSSSGLLSMPPPSPPAASGSFLAVSDQVTKVHPDGSYASAMFRAAPADASASSPGTELPPRPAPAPLRSAIAPPASRVPTLRPPVGSPSSPAPPSRTIEYGQGAAKRNTAPPATARTLMMSPSAPAPAPPMAASSHPSPAMPPLPPMPPLPGMPAPPASEPALEPEPVAEAADWGARALAALGTQAGIPVSLVPTEADAAGVGAAPLGQLPPPVSDPGIEEAFAFAPLPAPLYKRLTPQPGTQEARPSPIQAPVAAPLARTQLLEDELLENEPMPVAAAEAAGEYAAPEETAAPREEPVGFASESRPALEATAFVTDEVPAPETEPIMLQVTSSMPSPEPRPNRPPTPRTALRSRASLAADDLDDQTWQPGMSRAKKIAIVAAAAAVLGAGGAALTLGLSGEPKRARPPSVTESVSPKAAAPKAAAAGHKTAAPQPVAKVAAAGAAGEMPGKGEKAAAGKPAKTDEAAAASVAAKPAAAAKAEQPKKAAAAAPSPASPAKTVALAAAAAPAPAKAAEREKALSAVASGAVVRVPVTSQPGGARVWINGQERCDTPCTVEVKTGTARVVLVRPGHLTSQLTFDVREGTKIDQTLKPVEPPMTGEARFRAECQTQGKLPIVVDGKETGILCPFSKMRVDPGTHSIGLLIPATGKVHSKEVHLFSGVRSVVFRD